MSTFWSIWIIVLTVTTIGGSVWLLLANRKTQLSADHEPGEPAKTGHVYDGIEEYDNPLPAWWFWAFLGTVGFGIVYLTLFPGLGNFPGLLGWTQESRWEAKVAEAEEALNETFAEYAAVPVEDLAGDPAALRMGRRLFNNNCSVCHGVGGTGANGFPNLTDSAWLYGGTPQAISTSITSGRNGIMPPWGQVLGEQGVNEVTQYVLSLSGAEHNESLAEAGATRYATFCVACHAADGTGMTVLGAPNLTDDYWLYRDPQSTLAQNIAHTIRQGRNGQMPAHGDLLRDEKIHVITAYVYSLSHTNQ